MPSGVRENVVLSKSTTPGFLGGAEDGREGEMPGSCLQGGTGKRSSPRHRAIKSLSRSPGRVSITPCFWVSCGPAATVCEPVDSGTFPRPAE